MGLLTGIGLVVSLVLQIPLAVWSDRRRDQLRLVVRAAAASALVSLSIPVLWWSGLLTLPVLFGCVLAAAVVAAVRASLGHAIVNDLAAPEERVTAIGRLNGVSSGAEIGGQSGGSGLIAVMLYLLRDLGIPAAAVGLLLACGAVGGILGGFAAGGLVRRLGERTTLLAGVAAMGLGVLPVILARSSGTGAVAVVLFELFSAFGGTVLIATVFGRLQETTPRHAIARTMSGAEVVMQLFGLAGLGAGILLATAVGRRTSFVAYLAAVAAVLLIQLITARRRPAAAEA